MQCGGEEIIFRNDLKTLALRTLRKVLTVYMRDDYRDCLYERWLQRSCEGHTESWGQTQGQPWPPISSFILFWLHLNGPTQCGKQQISGWLKMIAGIPHSLDTMVFWGHIHECEEKIVAKLPGLLMAEGNYHEFMWMSLRRLLNLSNRGTQKEPMMVTKSGCTYSEESLWPQM